MVVVIVAIAAMTISLIALTVAGHRQSPENFFNVGSLS
jgi:hypothetical protein